MENDRIWKLSAEENAIDSLEMAIRQLMEIDTNPWAWKWVCFGLHDALYGFGVCAVAHSDPSNVTTSKGYLKNFHTILKMAQDPQCMNRFTNSKPLELTSEQQRSIDFLKKQLRNPLAHYKPSIWHVEVTGLPEMACNVLDVIESLAVESGNLLPIGGRLNLDRIKALCEAGRKLAQNSIAKQIAQEDADEIRRLKAGAPAIEVFTQGDGLPATIGSEVMSLSNDMKAANVTLQKRELPKEPTFHELFITIVGAVPFAEVKKIIDLIRDRSTANPSPLEKLTSSIKIYDLENRALFNLPEQQEQAVAHFEKCRST